MGARIKSFTERCYALKSIATKDFPVLLATVSGTRAIIAS